ncbi:MAG: protein kinase [Kouleothrix sp.]|nr:protein kinase [Kouleothrix sp.]
MLSPGTVIHQRYRVIQQIGIGGMGAVYKALDMRLNHTVAVKHMLMSPAPERVRAFEREAQLLARLEHPALPKVTDYFVDDDGHFLVMDFVDGKELASLLLARDTPITVGEVLGWADTLLDALVYLHEQHPQVIHRDIKPQNIKLTERGRVMLLDFGLAKGSPNSLFPESSGGSVHGFTLQYSSIEQIQGLGTSARSDLYSLAATLYHLLSGVPPANAPTRAVTLLAGQPDPLLPLHELNPQVPPGIGLILQRALAIRPEARFESARELRAALQAAGAATPATDRLIRAPDLAYSDQASGRPGEVGREVRMATARLTTSSAFGEAERRQPETDPLSRVTRARLAAFWDRRRALVSNLFGLLLTALMIAPVFMPPDPRRVLPAASVTAYLAVVGISALLPRLRGSGRHTLGWHKDVVLSVAFAPSGKLLGSAANDSSIHVWQVPSGQLLYSCAGHSGAVREIRFTPDGHTLISASDDGTVRLWRARDGLPTHILQGHTARVWSVAVAPDSRTLASASDDGTVRLWRTSDGNLLRTLAGHTARVWSVAFAPDGRTLASAGEDGGVRIWRVSDGALLYRLADHSAGISAVTFSPNGRLLASSSHDKTVKIWDTREGSLLRTLKGHALMVGGIAFDPEGRLLASRSEDATIQIWRAQDGLLLHTLQGHDRYISGLVFDPHGDALASTSWDATVRLWRVRDGQMLLCLRGHTARICDVAFAPDGHWLATCGLDRSVRLWRLRR